MGLRLTQEGVTKSTFFNRFGNQLIEIYGQEIMDLIRVGLLEWGGDAEDILRLTRRGRLLGNQVFSRFV